MHAFLSVAADESIVKNGRITLNPRIELSIVSYILDTETILCLSSCELVARAMSSQ